MIDFKNDTLVKKAQKKVSQILACRMWALYVGIVPVNLNIHLNLSKPQSVKGLNTTGYRTMKQTLISFVVLAFVVLAFTASLSVTATESVDETKVAETDGRVLIHNVRGEIRVHGWDKSEVRVQGDLDDRTEEFIFEVDGPITEIRVKIPNHTQYGDGSNLDIYVPQQNKVKFNGVSTDLEISDIEGGVSIHSVSGEVVADTIKDHIKINTVSGEVQVFRSDGRLSIVSVSGNLDLDSKATEVNLNTVSGDVNVELKEFESLTSSTVSGEIKINGLFSPSGDISMTSVSGDIQLRLDPPIDARIRVKTGPGGDIANHLTDDDPEEIFPAQMKLDTTSGDGSGRIKISTVTGDVRLDKN